MTIKVHCRTNLDDFRLVEWPKSLVGVPNKGDHVYSIDGKHRLAVVQVSHKTARDEAEPYAEVELHYDENMATLARLQRERTDAGRS
jgi:hypothetical protein